MSLLEIKRYLMQVKSATVEGLAVYFKCDQDVLRGMLTHWVKKGVVCRLNASGCNGCQKKCGVAPKTLEWYQWVG